MLEPKRSGEVHVSDHNFAVIEKLLLDEVAWLRERQSRVTAWVRECFTEAEAKDAPERSLRTAEEALELAQAVGVDAETLHRLVDYVFSRPVGKPEQEIAGTMVTLYAMANALGVDADAAFETELARIQTPEVMDRCRRRQHEKREALSPAASAILEDAIEGARRYASNDGRMRELAPFESPKKRKSWNP